MHTDHSLLEQTIERVLDSAVLARLVDHNNERRILEVHTKLLVSRKANIVVAFQILELWQHQVARIGLGRAVEIDRLVIRQIQGQHLED